MSVLLCVIPAPKRTKKKKCMHGWFLMFFFFFTYIRATTSVVNKKKINSTSRDDVRSGLIEHELLGLVLLDDESAELVDLVGVVPAGRPLPPFVFHLEALHRHVGARASLHVRCTSLKYIFDCKLIFGGK